MSAKCENTRGVKEGLDGINYRRLNLEPRVSPALCQRLVAGSTGDQPLTKSRRNSGLEIVVVFVCLERQWTVPEMSVRCGAASAVTEKPNSRQAVFVTVAASVRRWLRGC